MVCGILRNLLSIVINNSSFNVSSISSSKGNVHDVIATYFHLGFWDVLYLWFYDSELCDQNNLDVAFMISLHGYLCYKNK